MILSERSMRCAILGLAVFIVAGCSKTRTRDEIFTERAGLPQVFMGLKTGKQIVAPASKGVFVDPETKDEFWPTMECTNPDCPGRKGSEPVLFVVPRAEVNRGCPHCSKTRNLKNESSSDKAKYASFVSPYELPETKARLKELSNETKLAAERDARNQRK